MDLKLSPQEYAVVHSILCKTSIHPMLVADVVREHVVPRLGARASLLDVGAGSGAVARQLAAHFSKITLVEPNHEQADAANIAGAEIVQAAFEDMPTADPHDLVLCSHMLYHVGIVDWPAFIDRLLAHTRPGGYCLIALMAPRGPSHELHCEFDPDYANSGQLVDMVRQKGLDYAVYQGVNAFSATRFEDMYALCRFFALVDCFTSEQLDALDSHALHALDRLVRSHAERCRVASGYRLIQEEDYVLIRRS